MLDVLASGGVLLLLDQWSKTMVRLRLVDRFIACGPILKIRCVNHQRGAYRRDRYRAMLALTWLTALVSAIVLHNSGAWFQSRGALFGLGLALGGSLGNLLDVLRFRHVTDFIDLGWWPVFNLADVAIVVGLSMALWPSG